MKTPSTLRYTTNSSIRFLCLVVSLPPILVAAQGTLINYQGKLADGQMAPLGDMTSRWLSGRTNQVPLKLVTPSQIWLFRSQTAFFSDHNGFRQRSFDGSWLEISVCTNGLGAFTALAPPSAPDRHAIIASAKINARVV